MQPQPTSRAPLPLKITDRFYIDAWSVSMAIDGELTTTSGNVYEIPNRGLGAGLLHIRQLTHDSPTIRTVTLRDGRVADIILENIESIDYPDGADWADVTMKGTAIQTLMLCKDVADDLLSTWIANSQQGFPIPA